MKFYGNTTVWDADNDCILCQFENGELETSDKRVIEKLLKGGYTCEPETKQEIIAELDRKGVKYDARKKKAELKELL